MSIAERSDLYVNLFYRSDDVAAAGTNSGAEVEFGLRGKFSDKFEGDASFSSVGIGGGSNTAYKLGVAYAINDQYGITLGYANQNIYSPNLTQTYLGMRFNF
jgi:outer membrane autotransporter protein